MTKNDMLEYKKWAVVGDVLNEEKYAYRILHRLIDKGYEASVVHPRGGEKVSISLDELPLRPDIVCMVINPATGLAYLREAKELGVIGVWLQPGADTVEITDLCKELGLTYVQACVLVETRA